MELKYLLRVNFLEFFNPKLNATQRKSSLDMNKRKGYRISKDK